MYQLIMLNARQGSFRSQSLIGVQAICFGGHLEYDKLGTSVQETVRDASVNLQH